MSAAKRARTMIPVERVINVKRAVLFREALNLVQFHHAGFLNSFEADAVELRDVAVARLYRAMDITRAIKKLKYSIHWREIELEGARRIREFAPELVPDYDVDIFQYVWKAYNAERRRSDGGGYCGESPYVRHSMAHCVAKAAKVWVFNRVSGRRRNGVDYGSGEDRRVEYDLLGDTLDYIRVFAPELIDATVSVRLQIKSVIASATWVVQRVDRSGLV